LLDALFPQNAAYPARETDLETRASPLPEFETSPNEIGDAADPTR